MQSPIQPLVDWSKLEQNLAIVLCIKELAGAAELTIFEVFSEAWPKLKAYEIADKLTNMLEDIDYAKAAREAPNIDDEDYKALYMPLEHIINDRIDYYNAS
jgi:hypothetical protein